MLYIVTQNYFDKPIEWHVGEEFPKYFLLSDIINIQADGEELVKIRENYPMLVAQTGIRIQQFYGDIAKMIVANICR